MSEYEAEKLIQKRCLPCEGNIASLSREEALKYLVGLAEWRLSDDAKKISVEYQMKNFMAAVKFISKIAEVAEGENHHPDIHLVSYRKLGVELSTHAIGGLSENDFILAAKIDQLPKDLKQ